MVRGFCFRCHREVGGFLRPTAWQCPSCKRLYCENCPKRKVGRYFKKLACPECHVEMSEGGLSRPKET
ncbi:MAG: hypothetical protein OK456_01450 [Thaumarchaeota archaeon]|nr:hypothetical protein [Nitrososphaerota archaeon]